MTRARERSEQTAAGGLDAPGRATIRRAHAASRPVVGTARRHGRVLLLFAIYATWRAFEDAHYFSEPYLSPFYSPCLTDKCASGAQDLGQWVPDGWLAAVSGADHPDISARIPADLLLLPEGLLPLVLGVSPACAVAEPHKGYSGETRFPLIVQNIHRYFLYVAMLFAVLLSWDAIHSFRDTNGEWGHMGLGTVILLHQRGPDLGLHTLSCHSLSAHNGRSPQALFRASDALSGLTLISKMNARHTLLAWTSLVWLVVADFYIRCLSPPGRSAIRDVF